MQHNLVVHRTLSWYLMSLPMLKEKSLDTGASRSVEPLVDSQGIPFNGRTSLNMPLFLLLSNIIMQLK